MYPGKWAGEFPGKSAVIHAVTGEAVTYAELNDRSNQLAQLMWAEGLRPGDHAAYGPRSAARIERAMAKTGAEVLVTTAKDWIKLGDFWDPSRAVLVAELTLAWGRDKTLPELVGERLDAWRG